MRAQPRTSSCTSGFAGPCENRAGCCPVNVCRLLALLAALTAAACEPTASTSGSVPEPAPQAVRQELDSDALRSVEAYLSEPRFAAADLERGRILSLACQACHTFGASEDHNLGPNLHGMFGRPAAQLDGFAYSDALRASELVWTPQTLEAWLAEPNDFVPGNNMVFAGYGSATDRRDLLAWLLRATSGLDR